MDNYSIRKDKIQKTAAKLLQRYESLLVDTLEFGSSISHIFECDMDISEAIDWLKFACNDENMKKINRLMAALMYVEYPDDKEIINTLQENIALNTIEENHFKSRK